MLKYLEEWLRKRAGQAPVVAFFVGEGTMHEYIMTEVDEHGVVLRNPAGLPDGTAYPWSYIQSITPDSGRR